jgi:hypothetical protein
MRFQVLTAASMKFRIVFWDVLPCKIIVDNYITRQYIPEDNSERYEFKLSLCPDRLWGPPSLLYSGYRGSFPGLKRSPGMTLTTHPHLMPRSKMSRNYTSSPPGDFVACSGTALVFVSLNCGRLVSCSV